MSTENRPVSSSFILNSGLGFLIITMGLIMTGCKQKETDRTNPGPVQIEANTNSVVELSPETIKKKQPIVVQQEADGSFSFAALVTDTTGTGLEVDDLDTLRGWKDANQSLLWKCKVIQPGYFTVYADYTCSGVTDTAKIRVQTGKLFVEQLLPVTDGDTFYAEEPVGVLQLKDRGFHEITVRMTGLPLAGRYGLRSIRLVPDARPNVEFNFDDSAADPEK
ncbi:MAG: hypothetical protein COA78_24625 [Blastopirellula sp.]|nr:MAG: hypothetical protein COA78_24625 [Blastopirellula sp.]